MAAAARNETQEKEIQDKHSGGTVRRGQQACLRCGGWRAPSGSRHGRMLAQISTHRSGDGAVGCSRLIHSCSVPARGVTWSHHNRGGKGEVGQLALERRVKEKGGWVVKRLIIQLSSRIFFRRRSAISLRVPSIGWTTSQPILELSRIAE